MQVKEKMCRSCKEVKPIEEFGRDYRARDMHKSSCRACEAKRRKELRDGAEPKGRWPKTEDEQFEEWLDKQMPDPLYRRYLHIREIADKLKGKE